MLKEKIKGHTTARSKKIHQRKNLTGKGKYTVKAVIITKQKAMFAKNVSE